VDTLQIVVSGLALGAIYALIALGVVIILKASDLINFAHGELVMVGAIVAHVSRVGFGLNALVSFVLAVLVTTGVGLLIERCVYRPLRHSAVINVVLASVALSLLLQNLALTFWSEDTRAYPAMFSEAPILIGRFRFVPQEWATIAAALVCMLAFQFFFTWTRTGLAMRAVMLDRQTASLMGINVYRTIGNTFGLSAALGAAAGVLVAPLIHIHFSMGFILVKAFAAACLGGIFSIPGAILGGFIIGVTEGLVAAYVSSAYRDAIVYGILIAALLIRPEGLLGRR
jgi:branched-chain amino acid transport system permease protein